MCWVFLFCFVLFCQFLFLLEMTGEVIEGTESLYKTENMYSITYNCSHKDGDVPRGYS